MSKTTENCLQAMLKERPYLRILEAVDGLEAMIATRTAVINTRGETLRFDGLWLSGLCHAAHHGVPDDGKMPLSQKLTTLAELKAVSPLPILVDCDTGGDAIECAQQLTALAAGGAAAAIIEDKCGIKHNSLYGTRAVQKMENIAVFSHKLQTAKAAISQTNLLLFARIESLIAGESCEQAFERARQYLQSGADGIVIHSIRANGSDVFAFAKQFRAAYPNTPLVMIPTAYPTFSCAELHKRGANLIIYANHLTRSACCAMQRTAESILRTDSSAAADASDCISVDTLLTMIEGEFT